MFFYSKSIFMYADILVHFNLYGQFLSRLPGQIMRHMYLKGKTLKVFYEQSLQFDVLYRDFYVNKSSNP